MEFSIDDAKLERVEKVERKYGIGNEKGLVPTSKVV